MGLLSGVFAFDLPTIAINANDLRALTSQEMYNRQLQQASLQQNAISQSLRGLLATAQYQPPQRTNCVIVLSGVNRVDVRGNTFSPERPLDERFAAFKTRLAATVAKYPRLAT